MMQKYQNTAVVFLVLIMILITGCVQSVNENPTEIPQITITKPVSGDAVHVGKNYIQYTAKDYIGGPGLKKFVVVINGNTDLSKTFEIDETGVLPYLYIDIPENFLDQKIDYQVTVINKDDDQGTSQYMSKLPVGVNKETPEAPDTLTINRVTTSEVILSWKDLSNNEGRFEIFMSENDNKNYAKFDTVGANKTTANITSLSPHIKYYFKVRAAHNEYGNSSFSNEVNTSEAGGNEPYHLRAEAMGAKTVHLTWKNMSFIATKLKVQRKHESATVWADVETIQKDADEYYDTKNLSPGTRYSYRIGAYIQDKWQFSNETSVLTYTIEVPPPANLTAVFDPNTNKVLISWGSYPQNAVGTKIEKREGYNGQWISLISNDGTTDETSISDDNILAGKQYFYRARYYTTEDFNTRYSETVSVQIPQQFLPIAPSNVVISKLEGSSNYLLEWTDNSDNEDGFKVYMKNVGSDFSLHKTVNADEVRTVVVPVELTSSFVVRSYKGSLESGNSNEVSAADALSDFNILSLTQSGNSITLTWETAPDPFGNLLAYEVERKNINANGSFEKISGTISASASKSFTDSNVLIGVVYQYRILAKYATTTKYSEIKQITTK